jgi:NDP-sugar pyrophosphorylase family protein
MLKAASVSHVTVNVHAHADQVRAYLQSNPVPDLNLTESDETANLLGSAGGFRKALSLIPGETFFSMNADVIHLAPLLDLSRRHQELRRRHGVVMTLVLAGSELARQQAGEYREIYVDEASGLVQGFGEKKSGVPFYTGSGIFEKEAFLGLKDGVPAEFVPEVLEPAIRARKVGFLYSDALWIDIGSPTLWYQAQLSLEQSLKEGALPDWISKRLNGVDPSFSGRFELGKNRIRLDDIQYEIESLRSS